jgi:hypothetical protein
MKKLTFLIACLLLACNIVLARDAGMQFYSNTLTTDVDATGTALDIAAFKGNGLLTVSWGTAGNANYTGTVTIAHCTTEGGTYTTVTNTQGTAGVLYNYGVTTNEIDTFAMDLGALHKYVKVSAAHLNVSNNVSAVLVAPMKSQ